MTFQVNNTGNDDVDVVIDGTTETLHTNTIEVADSVNKYSFPAIAANTVDLNYFNIAQIPSRTFLIQSVVRSFDKTELHSQTKMARITQEYRNLIASNPRHLVDFTYQRPQGIALTYRDRQTLLDCQFNANAKIISDFESDRNQSVSDFENEIAQTKDKFKHTKLTISPTIDIGIEKEGLFEEKLRKALQLDFNRINIIFRSIPDNHPNWMDLSTTISGKSIWVNLVGVSQRWFNPKLHISQMSRAFLYGVHSASHAIPWRGTPNAQPYVLNGNTMCYNIDKTLTYPQSRAISTNTFQSELAKMAHCIQNKTFYNKYVPSRFGLDYCLRSIT